MAIQFYCGLDFHKNHSELCVLDSTGRKVEQVRVKTEDLVRFLSNRRDYHIAIEASGGVFDIARKLQVSGHRVTVINPVQFRAIGVGGKKTDRKDAEALATALRVGFIPEVHQKSEYARRIRSVLASRDLVMRTRVQLVNHVRGILREYGLPIPRGKREFLAHVDVTLASLECQAIRDILKSLVDQIQTLLLQEDQIEKILEILTAEDERIQRLQGVPGVGLLVASALIGAIDDPSRFRTGKEIGSYLGLVPKEFSSGSKRRLGSITRCGPEMVRRYLIHGARSVLLRKSDERSVLWAKKLEKRVGVNKAAVALAHKNARICLALLKNGTRYGEKPRSNQETAA